MSADIINLRQVRKRKARRDRQEHAAENRTRFGRTKAEREVESARSDKALRDIEGHRREKPRDPAAPNGGTPDSDASDDTAS